VESNARDKLIRKGCDLVIANDVSRHDIGFDSDENEILLIYKGETEAVPKADKSRLAQIILGIATNI